MGESGRDLPAYVDVGTLGRAILEAAHAARIGVSVALLEPSGPRTINENETAAAIVGWPAEALLEGDPLRFMAPEDLPMLKERERRRLAGEVGEKAYEMTIIRRDGKRAHVEVTTNTATVGDKPAVFAFMVDVTARRDAEAARRRS